MIVHSGPLLELDFFPSRPIQIELVQEHLSSDGGLLLFRQWDEELGFTAGFAAQLEDPRRDPEHTMLEMVRSRMFGILAGYEDQNDHDHLRHDALFKLLAGRLPDAEGLASQPTLSRFENAISARSLLRLGEWFLDQFVASFAEAPALITLDLDVFDDPTHGQQQLTFFHGFYDQHQYLVRVLTCAENDRVVLPVLLHGTARPTLGAEEDLERVVDKLREKFPDVRIHLRADSGYATPSIYQTCERLRIEYTIGVGVNPALRRESEELLEIAARQYAATGQPQRLFTAFARQARRWSQPRWMVIKCEANAQGTNRRAVVTNRPGARVLPQGVYDDYAARGESENRNKELKCELSADRLSDHRCLANCFRMFLHCGAHNLLVSLRQKIAAPPELPEEAWREAEPAEQEPADPESLAAARRRRWNLRRQADPLGDGHASTWRMMVIKVAARIQVRKRRVRVLLSQAWPFLRRFLEVGQRLLPET
jgi:hypothetical protein